MQTIWFGSLTLILISTAFVDSKFDRKTKPVQIENQNWKCMSDGRCVRSAQHSSADILSEIEEPSFTYLSGCKSVCGQYGSLWPKPSGETLLSKILVPFHFEDISLKIQHPEVDKEEVLEDMISQSFAIFSKNIKKLLPHDSDASKLRQNLPKSIQKRSKVEVQVSVKTKDLELSIRTKESYSLTVSKVTSQEVRDQVNVLVQAESYFGYRHAMETLSQLITYDPDENCLRMPDRVIIKDNPIYPYRGLLIDTGRNYYSLESMQRIIDAMSYNKLNVLHWHMNEQQSFPFVSERVPELNSFGAYSKDEVYYMDEIKSLVRYAKLRGVLLLPEFDAPAHAAYGWNNWPAQKGFGNLTTCLTPLWKDEFQAFAAEPPAGQLNPINENLYTILNELYKDLLESFADKSENSADSILPMFHMGGDEVNFNCWYQEKAIRDWMIKKGYEVNPTVSAEGYLQLWGEFQERALMELVKANTGKVFKDGVILWTSELTRPDRVYKYLNKEIYVIQVWTTGFDFFIADWLRMDYRLILSNYDAWYFDCGFGSWLYSGSGDNTNWCSPYKDWKVVYENSPRKIVENFNLDWSIYGKQILGGEAAMWSEQVDEYAVEAKLWPRGCALAERLWSDPVITSDPMDAHLPVDQAAYKASWWSETERRLLEHRHRMSKIRGIRSDALQPEFCRQNDGFCYNIPKPGVQMPVFGDFDRPPQPGFENYKPISQIIRTVYVYTSSKLQPVFLWIKYILIVTLLAVLVVKRRLIFSCLANVSAYFSLIVRRAFLRKKN